MIENNGNDKNEKDLEDKGKEGLQKVREGFSFIEDSFIFIEHCNEKKIEVFDLESVDDVNFKEH